MIARRAVTRSRHHFLIALLTLIAAPPLAAQSSDTTRLRDLVVTATRVPMARSSVPAATTVIRGDDLRADGIHFVLDALRDVPGMTVVQNGSYGGVTSVFLRGGESDDVKVLLDGVTLNRPGGGIDFASLTTDDLDRIEIVRGPSSVLYGADAMSGVIELFTRHPSGGHAELAVRGGTFGTSDLSAGASTGSAVSVSATGSRFGSDGSYAFNNGYLNSVGAMRFAIERGSAGQLAATFRYTNGTTHFPTDGGGNVVDHNQFSTERRVIAGIDASRQLNSSVALHLQLTVSRLAEGYVNRSDTPADTMGFGYIDDRTAVSWRRGADARADWNVRPRTLLSVGAGIEHETDGEAETSQSNFGFGNSSDTTAFSSSRDTRAGYAQLLATPLSNVSLQLGSRFDDNSAFGSFMTWRAGASWRVTPMSRIWAGTGTAFKAPTFSQLFASSAFEVGNPDLVPERSSNIEVGAEHGWHRHAVHLGVTAFWQRFRDLIQYVGAAPGDPTYVNLGGANSRGVETTATIALSHRLTINGRWTWLHTAVSDTGVASSAAFEEGKPLIRRPASSGGVTATWNQGGLRVVANVNHVGRRDDVDFASGSGVRVILPGYTTADVALDLPVRRMTPRSPGVELTLRLENLFDSGFEQTVGFPGRARTILAGARMQF